MVTRDLQPRRAIQARDSRCAWASRYRLALAGSALAFGDHGHGRRSRSPASRASGRPALARDRIEHALRIAGRHDEIALADRAVLRQLQCAPPGAVVAVRPMLGAGAARGLVGAQGHAGLVVGGLDVAGAFVSSSARTVCASASASGSAAAMARRAPMRAWASGSRPLRAATTPRDSASMRCCAGLVAVPRRASSSSEAIAALGDSSPLRTSSSTRSREIEQRARFGRARARSSRRRPRTAAPQANAGGASCRHAPCSVRGPAARAAAARPAFQAASRLVR